MNSIVGLVRHFGMLSALVLFVLGGLGQSRLVHASMTSDATGMAATHATASMPMDHAAMDSMTDADKTICELRCRALAVALPVSPSVLAPSRRARMVQEQAVLLPAPYWSSPDGPPPKHLIL